MALTGKTIGELALLGTITSDTLFAVESSGSTFHIPYSGLSIGGGSTYEEVTYEELYSMYTGSTLIPGGYYLITDFQTCYDRPNYDQFKNPIPVSNDSYVQCGVEPILVFATSENTLSVDAYQPNYPNDKIKYDINYTQTESGNIAFGRITERIDNLNNRTDYDHRNIEFIRYLTYFYSKRFPQNGTIELLNDGTVNGTNTIFTDFAIDDIIAIPSSLEVFFKILNIGSDTLMTVTGLTISPNGGVGHNYYTTTSGSYDSYYKNNVDDKAVFYTTFGDAIGSETAFNNYVGDYSIGFLEWGDGNFLLANNVFKSGEYINNKIGNSSYNNTFNDDCTNNTIGNYFYNNITDDDFDGNFIGNYFHDNLINANFQYNQIGENFNNNTVTNNSFYRNQIGNYFEYNWFDSSFGFNFQNNIIGNQFNNNQIYQEFYKNKIGNGYNNNETYSEFFGNVIGNGSNGNNIYSSFYDNQIGEYFDGNNIGDLGNIDQFQFYSNKIGNYSYGNNIRQSFYNNRLGDNFNNNTINGSFYSNDFGNSFGSNSFGNDIYDNKIENNFNNNSVNDDFRGNLIGNNFQSNRISNDFSYNKIGNYFYNNIFGDLSMYSWYDTSDLTVREYDIFYDVFGGGNIGNLILGKELVMHDTTNDEYYLVKFNQWTQNNNGGGFSYERTLVYPTSGPTVYFTKTNYGSEVDVIVPGVLEITRGNNGVIYNAAVEGSANNSLSPSGTQWNSIYTTTQNGQEFIQNQIGNDFNGNQIYERFGYNKIGNNFYSNVISNDFGYGGGNDYGNVINDDFHNNTIGEYMYNNQIGNFFTFNTVGNNFENNSIQNFFTGNLIYDGFKSNQIGNYFGNYDFGGSGIGNTIFNNFRNNKIGNYFGNDTNYPSVTAGTGNDGGNIINDNFQFNEVGDNFIFNAADLNFQYNKLGTDFWFNVFGQFTEDNVIGNLFVGNVGSAGFPAPMGDNFKSNKIGNYCAFNLIDSTNFESNKIGDYFGNAGLGTENNISVSFTNNSIGNYFGNDTSNVDGGNTIITQTFNNNLIGNEFYSNIIEPLFYRNDIGNQFHNNTLNDSYGGSEFQNNEIGNKFNNNTTDGYFYGNVIGGGFNNNNTDNGFYTNEIGFGFNHNSISTNFNDNVIYYYFNYNTIGDSFNKNIVKSYFQSNVIGNGFFRNNILTDNVNSNDFSSSTHVYGGYDKTFFRRQDGTVKLSYYDNTNTLTIPTNITD